MSDQEIDKQIAEAISHKERLGYLPSTIATSTFLKWLSHQQSVISQQSNEIEIIKSAKEALMQYTQECRKERDNWQSRTIEAEQQASQQLAEIESLRNMREKIEKTIVELEENARQRMEQETRTFNAGGTGYVIDREARRAYENAASRLKGVLASNESIGTQ